MTTHIDYRLTTHLNVRMLSQRGVRCVVRSLRPLGHHQLASTPHEADGQLWDRNYSPGPQRSFEAVTDHCASPKSLKIIEGYIAMNWVAP